MKNDMKNKNQSGYNNRIKRKAVGSLCMSVWFHLLMVCYVFILVYTKLIYPVASEHWAAIVVQCSELR